MTTKIGNWLDDRVGWRAVWEAIFLRKLPKTNWLYTLGSATLRDDLRRLAPRDGRGHRVDRAR